MTPRLPILALAFALSGGAAPLRAEEPKPAPPPAKTDAPKPDAKDEKRDDSKRPPRGERPPGPPGTPGGAPGQPGPGDRPDREWGPRSDWNRTRTLDQFSADELREMIRAVEGTSNKKLAEKMKERFEEAIARKPQQLTQEQLDEAMAVFEDREPYLAKRLKESLAKDPQRVSAMLAMQWPRLEKPIELKKTDRELYDAQTAEILRQGESRGIWWRLSHAIREKNQPEVDRLKAELKTKLTEQHQARQAIRKLELARLNDKIKDLSAEITREDEKSAEVLEKRYSEYVKSAENPRFGKGERGERPEKKEHEKKGE